MLGSSREPQFLVSHSDHWVNNQYAWQHLVFTFSTVFNRLLLFNRSVTSLFLTHEYEGFPALHYLLEFAQTHVRRVDNAIQPSHSQSPPSFTAFNLSPHWGLFKWAGSSHQVAKILELQLQHKSFQWLSGLISFRIDWFHLLSRVFLNTTVQKHPFFGTQPSLWSNSHVHTWLLRKL